VRRTLIPVFMCILLSGCGAGGPEADLDEYIDKLSRVLEQPEDATNGRVMPRLPAVRDLRREAPTESISILEFLQIRQCELQQLVAARNSSLGKLARPSQRLVYQLNFLRTGEACLARMGESHPELSAILARALEQKRQQLPEFIWQATLGGEEFRSFWRFGGGSLPPTFDSDGTLSPALEQLLEDARRWLRGDYRVDEARLERLLGRIADGNGGVQLRAWMQLSNKLSTASAIVDARLARRPLCFKEMHPPAADIFYTVVKEVFVRRIQVWAATLNSRYYELFPVIRRFEELLAPGEPPAYGACRAARDEALSHAMLALKRHVTSLHPAMDQCKLMPARR